MARWSFILSACWLGLMLAPASGIQMLGSISVYTQDMPNTIVDEFPDQLATFGPGLPEDGLRSMLVLADPPDGCYPLAPPPSEHFTTEKWTVLIARFNCTFEKKIRNAQAAGFDCAIVHNVNSSELETMSTMHPAGIDIPSVFVSDITGHQLGHDYTYSDGYFVLVQASQGPSLDPDDAMNTRLPLLFVVGGLCVLTMTGIVLVKYICNRRARAQPPWRPLHAPPLEKGAPRDDKLPAFLTTFTGPPKTKSKEEEANQAGCE